MENYKHDALRKSSALIGTILDKIPGMKKTTMKFMKRFFLLMLGLRGRYNFLNMERYGEYSEQTYRNNFDERFDFLNFNTELIKQSCSKNLMNAFDPSYISKSGKKTEHIGTFWSG